MNSIFSVGHSSHSWDRFYSLIKKFDIGVVLDVRSNPRSRLPHFNKHAMRHRLNEAGISYLWMGEQLGGKPKTGSADYEVIAQSPSFLDGVNQFLEIAIRCRPVLLCAEHENLECHRCLLIGRHLLKFHDVDVHHIHRDGTCEPHRDAEERMLARWDNCGDLFRTRDQRLDAAYRLQSRKIGVPA